MDNKIIKISIKPWKLIFAIVLVVVVGAIFLMKSDFSEKKGFASDNRKEIIMPVETGVSDSGLESEGISFSMLNAKTVLDKIEAIEGKQSLKTYFSENSNASVKINGYINNVAEGGFYKLSFLARNLSDGEKNINTSIIEKGKYQSLGEFTLAASEGVQYVEFNFQAENNASDLVFTSNDGKKADVWIDNIKIEKISVDSIEQMKNLEPTIFGNTSRFNIDRSQTESDLDSGKFFTKPNMKMGQIFSPLQPLISGIALRIQKVGTGGAGNYLLQIREYDDKLGIISDDVIASRNIYTDYASSVLDEIKDREQQIREEFAQKEKDILEGRVPNDETVDWYPPEFTQQQIDDSKAQKRKNKLEIAIVDMKASFNVPYEIKIPIATKLDTSKKYWIGIDNSNVKNDKRNYIKVYHSSASGTGSEPGFISKQLNMWQEYPSLWFKTFYSKHSGVQGGDLMSGSTISDFGQRKFVYRYKFDGMDYAALSGFPGRKIYDMYDGNYEKSDEFGNYDLSYDQYATYKFNTIYPAKKIIIRELTYNQSMAIDFSNDGENWEEVFSDNPAEDNQTANPFVINPEEKTAVFYLRIRPDGEKCVPVSLSLEAELEREE